MRASFKLWRIDDGNMVAMGTRHSSWHENNNPLSTFILFKTYLTIHCQSWLRTLPNKIRFNTEESTAISMWVSLGVAGGCDGADRYFHFRNSRCFLPSFDGIELDRSSLPSSSTILQKIRHLSITSGTLRLTTADLKHQHDSMFQRICHSTRMS